MRRLPSAVLFDLDGTLVDSEPLHRRAILHTMAQLCVCVDDLDPRDFVGRGERDFWSFVKDKFSLAPEVDALVESKDRYYSELVRSELLAMPGASACLERFREAAIPLGVASGSSPRSIAAAVAAVGIGHYFRELVSSLDPACTRSKPHPDVFLLAASRLAVDPQRCVVVEDAEWGVRAAKAAGMRVIAIPNDFTRRHDLTGADCNLSSLEELTFEHL